MVSALTVRTSASYAEPSLSKSSEENSRVSICSLRCFENVRDLFCCCFRVASLPVRDGDLLSDRTLTVLEEARLAVSIRIEQDYSKACNDFWSLDISQMDLLFKELKEELDSTRYKGDSKTAEEITSLLNPVDPKIANDVAVIIKEVQFLFQNLRIYYHDTQHTLEVALGTARAVTQAFKESSNKNSMGVLLAVTSALFHDIGYTNDPSVLTYLRNLPQEQYRPFFEKARGAEFCQGFESLLSSIKTENCLTGGEFHSYHVYLGQLIMALVLEKLKRNLSYGDFLLEPSSLEAMRAMISLTDVSKGAEEYQKERVSYLEERDLIREGRALATSDLLTQFSTSDRLEKGLFLYDEFIKGGESTFSSSGLDFLASSSWFYENVAKKRFDEETLSFLDKHFVEKNTRNTYSRNGKIILFFYEVFKSIYAQFIEGEILRVKQMTALEGLKRNGLQSLVVSFFKETNRARNKESIDFDSFCAMTQVLMGSSSLEVALADEIRITLMLDAANSGDFRKVLAFARWIKNPNIWISRIEDIANCLCKADLVDRKEKNKIIQVIMRKTDENRFWSALEKAMMTKYSESERRIICNKL